MSIFNFNLLFALFFTQLGILQLNSKEATNQWHTLQDGNKKFIKNQKLAQQRAAHATSQNPRCIVLGCADSSVPPEVIFDRGLGELFVTRVAGHVTNPVVIDSIEYAIAHSKIDTIVILGHNDCKAVTDAIARLKKNGGVIDQVSPGHLNNVLIPIETAILAHKIHIHGKNATKRAVKANIAFQTKQLLKNSTKISKAVKSGKIKIIGASYDLKTGRVH